MRRGIGCLLVLGATGGPLALACHAYDEAAYDRDTHEGDDDDGGGTDAAADVTTPADAAIEAAADALAEAAPEDSGVDAGDASCTPISGAEPCTAIPELQGTQVVDGTNSEFCNVPYLTFNAGDGVIPPGTPEFPTPAPVLTLQVAWTSTGLAVFAHVDETDVSPPPEGGQIYDGDAIELFVAASSTSLTGDGGGDQGTFHFILAATSASGQAVGESYPSNAGPAPPVPIQSSTFVGKLVAGGYDLEATFPWANFGGKTPTTGTLIGFDFGVDIASNKTPDAGVDSGHLKTIQTFYFSNTQKATKPNACGTPPEPFCDDRTWCTPHLE
jgi:hypothetical protein